VRAHHILGPRQDKRPANSRGGRAVNIPGLDGIRALAICVVFLDHAGLPQVIFGSTGVTIFFFLSGYLITSLLRLEFESRGRISYRDFYVRRAFRILPPMYLALLVAVGLSLAGRLANAMTLGGSLAPTFFYTNYWIVYLGRDELPAGTNAFWSLAVEEHYYLIFPLLFMLLMKRMSSDRARGGALLAVSGAILCWRIFLEFILHAGYDRVYLSTDTRLDSILLGAALALTMNPHLDFGEHLARRGYWLCLGLSVALFAIARELPQSLNITLGYSLEGAGCWLAFIAVVRRPQSLLTRILQHRAVVALGTWSYAFYLIHRLVLQLVARYATLGTYPDAAISFLLTVAASWLVHRWIEQPSASIRRHFLAHEPPAPTIAEPTPSRGSTAVSGEESADSNAGDAAALSFAQHEGLEPVRPDRSEVSIRRR
jgi:peptidoglycan/LPS O-acetylase OafA/YrhL